MPEHPNPEAHVRTDPPSFDGMKATTSDPHPVRQDAVADGPLTGLRVLDLATIYAGPMAATMLGDFGADVIKVEHPRGDPARTHGYQKDGHGLWWKVLSRNKRTVTANISREEGRELVTALARTADVLIENFRPGVLEKWDLGPDVLHRENPRLIILRLTGFGQTGPYAQRRAFGTLIEAMSGFAHMTGAPDGPPTLPPFGLADGLAGMAGAYAVMCALRQRDTEGGLGQVIDLSLLEPLLMVLGPGPTAYDQLGVIPGRHGNRSQNNAPRNTYRTRDGRWVAISSSSQTVAERVMHLVEHPEVIAEPWFASAGQRVQHADLLDEYVGQWIASHDFHHVNGEFERVGAALAPVNTIADLMADPHVNERQVVTTVHDDDLGPIRMQNLAFRLSQTPGRIRFTGRRVGQDNEEVYCREIGLPLAQLQRLREEGIV
jgi:crotonobetainyl-CoA:carnitine CoA-transferase CaiB-like acyl-CoA transferase